MNAVFACNIRSMVMDEAPGDRLWMALHALELLTGSDTDRARAVSAFGLTPSESAIFCALNARAPRWLSKDALRLVVDPLDQKSEKLLDVFVCKLRKKLPPGAIYRVWGQGYGMAEQFDLSGVVPARPVRTIAVLRPDGVQTYCRGESRRWSPRDDQDLRRMIATGSDVAAMAYELNRSERGILDRVRVLNLPPIRRAVRKVPA